MTLKIGINGFGRIGRMILRCIVEQNRKDLEIVAINNKANSETSSFLLANDTIHGKLKSKINYTEKTINILFRCKLIFFHRANNVLYSVS